MAKNRHARPEVKKTVIKGSFWTVFSNLGNNIITFFVTVVLARLLTPQDFGIIAISAVFVGIVSLFQDLGMGAAIIQRQNIDDDYLSTSFVVSLLAGAALALALCAVSPLVARFYGEDVLKYILMVSSAGFVISPFISIHTTILTKTFEFRRLAFITILTQTLAGGLSITLAFLGFGVWSLVLGKTLTQPVLIPVVWHIVKWRPRAVVVKKCFTDLFGYSSNLLGFHVFNFSARNLDNLIIGKYLGAQTLGFYSIAYGFMLKPLELVSWSIGRVLFPIFSTLQDDKERTRAVYLKILRSISLVTFPMMTGLVMVAEEFIITVYGTQWSPVVAPLRLLCIVGAIQSIGTTGGVILNSSGRPDLTFKLGSAAAVLSVISFVIGVRWGLNGLIAAYILVTIPNFVIGQYFVNRVIGLKMGQFFRSLAPAALCSVLMVSVLAAFRVLNWAALHLNLSHALVLFITVGTVSYMILVIKVFKVPEASEAYEMVRRRL